MDFLYVDPKRRMDPDYIREWWDRFDAEESLAGEMGLPLPAVPSNAPGIALPEEAVPEPVTVDGMDPDQSRVVLHPGGPALVMAGAGSGKTRTIVARVVHLLKTGTEPSSILCLTFTKKAANEMRERIEKEAGSIAKSLTVSTFHALALDLIRTYPAACNRTANFSVWDDETQLKEIRAIIKGHPNAEKWTQDGKPKEWVTAGQICDILDKLREDGEPIPGRRFEALYGEIHEQAWEVAHTYQTLKTSCNALDFADFVWLAARTLLDKESEHRTTIQSRWSHVIVDEYQDTNHIQEMFLSRLVENHRNLMVVGDEDQSIYAFRGSNVHYIRSFPRRYEGAVVYLLGRNYRSTPNVIESANALISQNRERHYKRVWSENEPGRQISMKQWVDPHEEARATAYEIELARAEGWPDEELAILVRTRRQFVPLQVELQKRQIPFHVVGDAPWYARADVRTVLAWMRATINPRDLDAGAEVLKSWDGLGNGAVKAWKDAMESVGDAMFGRIAYLHGLPGLKPGTKRGQRLADFQKAWREWDQPNSKESLRARVEWLFHTLGIVQQIIEAKTSSRPSEVEDGNRREAFLRLVLDIVPDEPESGGWDGMRKWMDDLFTHTTSKNDNKGGVCLSTIHGSKGLEWGCVWLPGWSAGIFPGERAETPEQIEEERRLAYVALTRAKDYLSVSWFDYTQVPRPRACGPCLFIAEMDPENAKGEDWTRSEDPALSDLPPPPACVPTVTYANGWAQERWFVDSFAETVDRATDMDEAEHLWSGWDESVTVLGVRGVEVHPEGDGSLCIACQRMLRVSVSLVLESPSRPKAWTIRLGRRCAARLLNHRGQIFDALRAAKDMGLIREVPIVKGSLFTYSRSESWVWPAKPQTTVERGGGNALFVHHNEPKENE